jgi:hypothetical protein
VAPKCSRDPSSGLGSRIVGLASTAAQISGVETSNKGPSVAANRVVDTDQTSYSAFVIGPL